MTRTMRAAGSVIVLLVGMSVIPSAMAADSPARREVHSLPIASVAPAAPLPVLKPGSAAMLPALAWEPASQENVGRRLVIIVPRAADLTGVEISETPTSVQLVVRGTRRAERRGGLTTLTAISKIATVELPHPLGQRRLVGSSS